MAGIFISATGTGIGKTYLTEQLLRFDSAHEQCLTASKPIISGWPQNKEDIQHTDTGIILRAQQLPLTDKHIQDCSPWRFRAPLTPSMAAKKEGNPIDDSALVSHCRQKIALAVKNHKIHLLEGVGGIMAPISSQMTCLSWLKQLDCACILVTGSYLGTLSHTMTALTALANQQIPVKAVVVSETPNSTVSLEDTVEALAHWATPLPVLPLPINCCDNDLAMVYFVALKVTRKAFSCDLI